MLAILALFLLTPTIIACYYMAFRWLLFRLKRKRVVTLLRHCNRKLVRNIPLNPAEKNLIDLWWREGYLGMDWWVYLRDFRHPKFLVDFQLLPLVLLARVARLVQEYCTNQGKFVEV